jgi:predicted dinucleotide-binding enzyme
MKILFIGGTGNISSAVSKLLTDAGHDFFMLNRGNCPPGIRGFS